MIIAIVGSRDFDDYEVMEQFIFRYVDLSQVDAVVSGGAIGADTLGRQFAQNHNIELFEIKPEWKKYGKRAGFMRNDIIISNSDIVFAFWDGQSKGTKHSIGLA